MKKALTLSIVIPVYNEEDYIKPCLDSIAKQAVMPDEVVVVDNNSTDRTVEIAKKYQFVRVIKESTQGVLYARNTGFDAAKCDIIGRIDADTRLSKDWVSEVKKAFKDDKIAAVTGPVWYYDMPIQKIGLRLDRFFRGMMAKKSLKFPFLFGTNMAIRRSAWEKVRSQLCEERAMYEDIDLALHMSQKDLSIEYKPDITAGMSARRLSDHPRNFYRYIRLH